MVYHAILVALLGFGKAEGWLYDSQAGAAVYVVLLLLATLAWLSFQLRFWFGWPDERQRGPLRLDIEDRTDASKKTGNRHVQSAGQPHPTDQKIPKSSG